MSRGRTFVRRSIVAVAIVALALLGYGWARERPSGATGRWLAAAGLEPRFETVAGHRIRFVRQGSGSAVLLLHGFASSIYTWKDVLPTLARGHDVVALDFPAFGQSDRPPNLSFDEYVPVVIGLLDRLGIERVAVVGNSMGGAVAALLAGERPERVARLVLIDAAGFRLEEKKRPWPVQLIGMRPVAGVLERLPLRRLLVGAGLRQVFYDDSLVTAERVDEYLEAALAPGTPAALRSLLASRAADPDAVQNALARIAAPTLILWGRDDGWVPVADADRFKAAIPGSHVVVLDRCGHVPQEERPAEVSRLIGEFIRD